MNEHTEFESNADCANAVYNPLKPNPNYVIEVDDTEFIKYKFYVMWMDKCVKYCKTRKEAVMWIGNRLAIDAATKKA